MMRVQEWAHEITYPWPLQNKAALRLWLRFCCPRGWHLLDQVTTLDEAYLSCAACGLLVFIEGSFGIAGVIEDER